MDILRFGTAGIPLSTQKPSTLTGIARVRELGLDCMELEFVHSVNVSKELAPAVKKTAQDNDIILTAHGQYYINLNAQEKEKMHASIQRVLNAARILHLCGGYSLTFHAGFYLGMDKPVVYDTIKKNMQLITKTLHDEGNNVWVRPETTGKETQWGDLQEILNLSRDVEHVMPCIDFSHLHARYNGRNNTKQEFSALLGQVEKTLGKEGLQNMHIHISGINYGEKGEKNHLLLKESDFNYTDLLLTLKSFNVRGCVICESPNIEGDAVLLQKTFGG
ncbi:MAG: TIM barrel protein [archaeon]